MAGFSQRQKQIIDESILLISEKGIQELTIKNIARNIGVSEPAIYRHFTNKLDIILSILDYFQEMSETFITLLPKNSSELEKIEQIFLTRLKTFSENKALAGVVFSEELFRNDPRLSSKVKEIMYFTQSKLTALIESAQVKQDIPSSLNAKHIAIMILGTLRLLVTRWRMEQYSFDLVAEGKNLWRTIVSLLQLT
ncbi:MAG: TetR/AcrR family transcriptional regulator [Candidatus Auribacterota bacterium]|jgi:AcrR family transcriptional regulator|nr:TetR/AcrR family transcriptional regulator [Candidatus Auribacterota bacterium]